MAQKGGRADNRSVMHESTPHAEAAVAATPVRTLVLAVLAPFGTLALLASPLLFDAIRHAAGL
jgi:hypothetical protein